MNINKPVLYSFISLTLRLLTNPLTVTLIALKLTEVEQGIYYTFISVAAIQWVFELGVSTCLVQRLSAAKDQLKTDSYIKFGLVFFFSSSVVLFISLYLYSAWVYKDMVEPSWEGAWLFYSFFICVNLINNFSIIIDEGRLNVEKAYKCRMFSGFAYSLGLVLSLYLGCKLFSLGVAQLFIFIVVFVINGKGFICEISRIFNNTSINLTSTFKEIWNFQYKLSLVWVFGYFYWNAFAIFFFKYESPEFAGKYGITIALFSALATIMSSWLTTKRASLGRMISEGNINDSIRIFCKSSLIAITGYLICSFFVYIIIGIKPFPEFINRFLTDTWLLHVVLIRFVIMLTELLLIYLRAYNDEPLFKETVINYLLVPIVIYLTYLFNEVENILIYSSLVQVFMLLIMSVKARRYVREKKNRYSNVCL